MSNDSEMVIDDGMIGFFDWFDPAGAAEEVFEQAAGTIVAYAQANAPWTDRTGQARGGLEASVTVEGGDVILELYHTAEHGLWLEVIQSGRFAIIMPTLELFAPQVFAEAGGRITSSSGGEL